MFGDFLNKFIFREKANRPPKKTEVSETDIKSGRSPTHPDVVM